MKSSRMMLGKAAMLTLLGWLIAGASLMAAPPQTPPPSAKDFPALCGVPGTRAALENLLASGNNLPTSKGEVWCVRILRKQLRIYLLGGQSNASGCASCIDLPPELPGPQKIGVAFARARSQLKEYGWDWLNDGLGDAFGNPGAMPCVPPSWRSSRPCPTRPPSRLTTISSAARDTTTPRA